MRDEYLEKFTNRLPSVSELVYFFEVCHTLNLTHAAKNLHISQPSLSRAIQSLETLVGTKLLIRNKKGVVLTPAGKKIALQIKPLLQNWHNTKIQALASHHEVEGSVKIGCYSATGFYLHPVINDLLTKYPKLNIELVHLPSEKIVDKVIDLTVDIALVTNPIQYPDLIIKPIAETHTTLWTTNKPSKLQKIDSGEAVAICHPDIRQTAILLNKCKLANIHFDRVMRVNNIEVIANLTANGCGVGLLPSCLVQCMYETKLKKMVHADLPVFSENLYLVYHKEYMNVEAVRTVIATIRRFV